MERLKPHVVGSRGNDKIISKGQVVLTVLYFTWSMKITSSMESVGTCVRSWMQTATLPAKGKRQAARHSQLPGPQGLLGGEDGGMQSATKVSQSFPLMWISSTSMAFKNIASKITTELKPWSHQGDER